MALDFKSPICIYVPTNQPLFFLFELELSRIFQNCLEFSRIVQNCLEFSRLARIFQNSIEASCLLAGCVAAERNNLDHIKKHAGGFRKKFLQSSFSLRILRACLQQCDSISPAISGTGSNQRGIEPSLLGSFIPKYWSVTLQNIYIMGRENMEQEKSVDMGMGCGGGEHAFI